ncbi:hypothetical protein DSM112329_01177 [Paraconexibacter sp. AEG42_29]|uniref:Circularly permuted ATP-grasp type 2 domain-containing protein n=1 Tax=Paraconexibacter sp. AEG42_29 TaxID=2997339 RepID=A0AAU7ARR3_9ACTN
MSDTTSLLDAETFDESAAHGGLPTDLDARLPTLQTAVMDHARQRGVSFAGTGPDSRFVIDPYPRVIDAATWADVERGLKQRALALDAFVRDVHGTRSAVADGVIPARVIESCANLDPGAAALGPRGSGQNWIGIAGLDLIRDASGRFLVLEDNCRTPSGLAYALAAREALQHALEPEELDHVRTLGDVPGMLRATLDAARPDPARPTEAVVLTDGPRNSAYYEHRRLAVALGVPLVTPNELQIRADQLWTIGGEHPVNVVYRRTDEDLSTTSVGRFLSPALQAGTLGLVNAFGTGVADDKLTHVYVERLVRYYLGEEPLLPSVRGLDLGTDAGLAEADDRLAELVVKPRGGFGGIGVTICAALDRAGLDAVREQLHAAPDAFVAQELVPLSTHPTVIDGVAQPRHVDLRPFVMLAGESARVVAGGLTRVALREGSMIVNSSQEGGAKDTWILR